MNESELLRICRQWLEEGPTTISDRALSTALAEVDVTHQRRTRLVAPWPSARFAWQLAAATIAGVLLAVLGIAWLGRAPDQVGVGQSASPPPTLPLEPSVVIPAAIGLAFGPDGSQLYARGPDRTATIYDAGTGAVIRMIDPAPAGTEDRSALTAWGVEAFSPDGELVAVGMTEGGSRLYDTLTGALVRAFPPCCMATFSADGRYLASGTDIFDIETGEIVNTLPMGGDLTLSPDGTRVLVSGRGGDTANGDLPPGSVGAIVDALEPGRQPIILRGEGVATGWNILGSGAAWSADGAMVAQPTSLGNALVWDSRNGDLLNEIHREPTGGSIDSVAFSPDSTQLATGMSDGSLVIWDLKTSAPTLTLQVAPPSSASLVIVATFSPDGRRLMGSTWSDVGSKVWDLTS